MNYYEHHIGDYDEATSHLSAVEDGIYSRMLRKYYATEQPLIADVAKLQRLMRAKTREEKQAVVDILDEFFRLDEDGWHQDTCDEVIAAYQAGEPEREVKKANEDNRLRRHREERARLFKSLTDAGQHAAWNISIVELRELVKALPETKSHPPATAPATPATATQTPLTSTHIPIKGIKARTGDSPGDGSDSGEFAPTKAGQVGMALKAAGVDMSTVNLSDPLFAALLQQGATAAEFAGLAEEAIRAGKRKPWKWILTVLPERRKDAQALQLAPLIAPKETERQRTARDRVAEASGVYAGAVVKTADGSSTRFIPTDEEVIHAPAAAIAIGND